VKLGRRGIREIEFIVQTLAAIHGARQIPFLVRKSSMLQGAAEPLSSIWILLPREEC